jgi:hypothetical protein
MAIYTIRCNTERLYNFLYDLSLCGTLWGLVLIYFAIYMVFKSYISEHIYIHFIAAAIIGAMTVFRVFLFNIFVGIVATGLFVCVIWFPIVLLNYKVHTGPCGQLQKYYDTNNKDNIFTANHSYNGSCAAYSAISSDMNCFHEVKNNTHYLVLYGDKYPVNNSWTPYTFYRYYHHNSKLQCLSGIMYSKPYYFFRGFRLFVDHYVSEVAMDIIFVSALTYLVIALSSLHFERYGVLVELKCDEIHVVYESRNYITNFVKDKITWNTIKGITSFSKETSCNICFNEFDNERDMRILRCGHYYHSDCVIEWSRVKRSCPKCRTDIDIVTCSA